MILETLSLTVRPQPSGEPDAGKPPVRFGGRGDFNTVVPTPIYHLAPPGQRPRKQGSAPRLVIPMVSRSSGENGRSLIFYQNEGAFGGIIGQGCSTR
jgi:hypothetical protein